MEPKKFSIKKNLLKGGITALSFAIGIIAFTSFSDVQLWALLETYVKPLVGSLTVSAVLGMALNFLKFKAKGE